MQLGRGEVKFSKKIYFKLIKRDSKMRVREKSKIHINKVSLGRIRAHKDTFNGNTRFNDHHIRSIDVKKLNGLKEISNKLISRETTFIEYDFLVNPGVAQKGYRRELLSDLTRFSRRKMRNKQDDKLRLG